MSERMAELLLDTAENVADAHGLCILLKIKTHLDF
jgi:hypothetical protein